MKVFILVMMLVLPGDDYTLTNNGQGWKTKAQCMAYGKKEEAALWAEDARLREQSYGYDRDVEPLGYGCIAIDPSYLFLQNERRLEQHEHGTHYYAPAKRESKRKER